MSSIIEINELTSNIIRCENEISQIDYRLGCIVPNKSIVARLHLEVNGRRSGTTEWLTKEEVILILTRRRKEEKDKLDKLNAEYLKIKT